VSKRPNKSLQQVVLSSPFESAVSLALTKISTVELTQTEYARDFATWRRFCGLYHVAIADPGEDAVTAFMTWMKREGMAPKTRARRMSALSSIYRELRRRKHVPSNPFSPDEGPNREKKPRAIEPTQLASPEVIRKILGTCDDSLVGIRDAAIIRVFWSTGMRRVSLLSMTHERMHGDRLGIIAKVDKKGGGEQQVLIRGKALEAFDRWLVILKDGRLTTGAIWRDGKGKPLTVRELNRALERRGGDHLPLSPHMLRVAFITYNPAPVDAKQDAVGHADVATTMMYDRRQWRGLEAFQKMPEIEDVED
jgi:integrase/recombinase XerD